MNNNERISYLLGRYLADQLTDKERSELFSVALNSEDDVVRAIGDALETEILLQQFREIREPDPKGREEVLKKILASDKTRPSPSLLPGLSWQWGKYSRLVAAAVVLLIVTIVARTGLKFLREESQSTSYSPTFRSGEAATHTRAIFLPDSSFVVLKAGSVLEWPEQFSGTAREITLIGEAYFDIRHLRKGDSLARPFIIHTVKVKTTVLGTAFHIKANPEEKNIMVSVTRGRVKVENESRVLAVLTQNQYVTYTPENLESESGRENPQKRMDWIRADMEFDGVSFESIVGVLEKRYGVRISFSNPLLKECMIVASFSGTETLQNVLETLCTIRNASFREEGPARFTIFGNGCD